MINLLSALPLYRGKEKFSRVHGIWWSVETSEHFVMKWHWHLIPYIELCAMEFQGMKRPKLFWVSAGAPLVSVVISTLLVFAFKAQHHGIGIVSFWPYLFINFKSYNIIMWYALSRQTDNFTVFLFQDRKIARRTKSPIMEIVEVSCKPSGISDENWTCHWHYFSHCKFSFYSSWFCFIFRAPVVETRD